MQSIPGKPGAGNRPGATPDVDGGPPAPEGCPDGTGVNPGGQGKPETVGAGSAGCAAGGAAGRPGEGTVGAACPGAWSPAGPVTGAPRVEGEAGPVPTGAKGPGAATGPVGPCAGTATGNAVTTANTTAKQARTRATRPPNLEWLWHIVEFPHLQLLLLPPVPAWVLTSVRNPSFGSSGWHPAVATTSPRTTTPISGRRSVVSMLVDTGAWYAVADASDRHHS